MSNLPCPVDEEYCREHCRVQPGIAIHLSYTCSFTMKFEVYECTKFGWSVTPDGLPAISTKQVDEWVEQEERSVFRQRHKLLFLLGLLRMKLGGPPTLASEIKQWLSPEDNNTVVSRVRLIYLKNGLGVGPSLQLNPGESILI